MRTLINHAGPAPATVSVNGTVIPAAAIAGEVQHHPEASPQAAWQAAARALVVRELLLQRARSLGLAAVPQAVDGLRETAEEALIRTLLETEVRVPSADEATCQRYYAANPARFRSPDLFEPQHILFRTDGSDPAAHAAIRARAAAVLAEVTAAPGRFDALARALSECPSAQDGGRLGQVTRGDTTPAFEAALQRLAPGETCPTLVETRYGIHVLRLERKVEGRPLPFAQVQARIAAWLEDTARRRALGQYVRVLAGQAAIAGCDLPAASSPLVQ